MHIAKFIRVIEDWKSDAKLYALSVPLEENSHVVVASSAVEHIPGTPPIRETLIFGSDSDGHVLTFDELPGSYIGDLNHEEALRRAGYTVFYTP
jgi:hypothetical protein